MRIRVIFNGFVQGVGFRFSTLSIARKFSITGFVRNEPDGSVLAVAEGDECQLRSFFAAVKAKMKLNIRSAPESIEAATGEFCDFRIEY